MSEIKKLFDSAKSHYEKKGEENLRKAIPLFEFVAELDTPLGNLYSHAHYLTGKCYEQLNENDKAFAHYNIAYSCHKPHIFAINSLGICYYTGIGVEKDFNKAFSYFSEAAEQGYDRAQYNAGLCHYYKDIDGKSYEKAFDYFLAAHNQKHSTSTKMIALCYADGLGVKQNYQKAYEYMLMADKKDAVVKPSLVEYATKIGNFKAAKNHIQDILNSESDSSDQFKQAKKQLIEIDSNLIPKALEKDFSTSLRNFPNIKDLTEKYGSFNKDFIYDTAIKNENLGNMELAIQFYIIAAANGSKKALYTLNNMSVKDTLYFSNIMDYSGEDKK